MALQEIQKIMHILDSTGMQYQGLFEKCQETGTHIYLSFLIKKKKKKRKAMRNEI